MSARVLVTGSLFKAPEQRTSKTGKPFVVATIRVKDGEALQWWRVTVFSEGAMAELMRLSDGDAVSAQGAMTAGLYVKDGGETKITLQLVADQILALRAAPKERKAKAPDPSPPQDTRSRQQRCGAHGRQERGQTMICRFEGSGMKYDHVLAQALDIGLPVFPCKLVGKDKVPARPKRQGGNGFHDATDDPKQIRELWRHWPGAPSPAAQIFCKS
jgi:single-stranded DNA-binding protein